MRAISEEAWKLVHVHGRTKDSDRPTLFWTGSGVELAVKATSLSVRLYTDYSMYEQYVTILVNGAFIARTCLRQGDNEITILRNMNPENVYRVRIMKDTLPPDGLDEGYIDVLDILTDGELVPFESRPNRILFIGDSITCGEGALGAKQENDWVSMLFSSYLNYSYLTAEALNAEYQAIAQSGWGIYCGYNNDVTSSMPSVYTKICGLLEGPEVTRRGAHEEYDFDEFQPEVIVLSLGTNDTGAFDMEPWTDPDTGVQYKQYKLADGTFEKESVQRFVDASVAFLELLRSKHPHAHILWVYGMIGHLLEPHMLDALERYQRKSGDENCSYLRLPETTDETVGSRMHPGYLAHLEVSKVLATRLREFMK